VHLHAYDEASGRQTEDPDVYTRIIEGIRTRVDAIVYPTILPPAQGQQEKNAAAALWPSEELARRRLIDGRGGPDRPISRITTSCARTSAGFVYLNSRTTSAHGLNLAMRYGFIRPPQL